MNEGGGYTPEEAIGEIPPEEAEQVVPYAESKVAARVLLEQYKDRILENAYKDVNNLAPEEREYLPTELYQNAIRAYIRKVPEDIQKEYWGHGVTKGHEVDQLAAAINLLENSAVTGDFGQLQSEYISAYTSGSFLVIADHDEPFQKNKNSRELERILIGDRWALKFNLGALVVNTEYYPLIEKLQEMFPGRNIIKASEMPQYLEQDANLHQKG